MDYKSIIFNRSGRIGLPPDFEYVRPMSSFGHQLAAVQNQPAKLKAFLWEARDQIALAREAASHAVRHSEQASFSKVSPLYRIKNAIARELGVPYALVKYVNHAPVYCNSPTP